MFSATLRVVPVPSVKTGARMAGTASANTMLKMSLMAALPPSVAVTLTVSVPTAAAGGVPLKVRVPGVKFSQEGSAVPSDLVAA